ncbi:CBBY-like protein [Selaginella moellendorffii]|uniref:CBBY-like protein n=1 Tax=Selaginella moellendorffii TaxID=88036 RepID=UPI000D1D0CA9|nr:CBBY-like protein [Selaginella moellendorffii]|eukprot:XP_002988169.2 CBBY-like protein [Selaginella moellendorffii]
MATLAPTSGFRLGGSIFQAKPRRFSPVLVSSRSGGGNAASDMAVFLEIDGVVADLHRHGHRQSFNVAFQRLGLDCANWTEPVYLDLLRQAGSDETQMLTTFFDRIGWPMSLPTNEKDTFVRKLMESKQHELETLAASDAIPIRPDLTSFVDEAMGELVPVVFISSYSKSGERVARLLLDKLGMERLDYIKIVGSHEVESSAYGQVVLGLGVSSSPDELLATEVAKAVSSEKQRLASEVASTLKLKVDLDTTSSVLLKTTIAALRAAAETAGVPIDRGILLAGAYLGTEAASRISLPCVVVRSSLTARAEFPLARATLEGFGAGAITLSRLRKYLA